MRLFTGLDLSGEVVCSLEALLSHLRPAADWKWSPPANLHITTRFIGEWPEARLPELRAALAELPSRPPIAVHIHRLGYFPTPYAPRVFWAGVEAPADLPALAAEIDGALDRLGLPPEGRPFRPHLTLARAKERVPATALRDAVAALPSLDFGAFDAHSFFLYQSRPGAGGSVYTKLAEFPLTK